jgi:hypothetical protein
VTEAGSVEEQPLDTSRVHVKLSATSFRIPPRGTYTVFYEASADSVPAWFSVQAALSGARTDNGLNVRIILPHVVYLNQKQPLARDQVVVRRIEVDSAARRARVELENLGPNLGRVQELALESAGGDRRVAAGFPLFPHWRRWVEVPWDLGSAPVKAQVRFARFGIDTTLAAAPVEPGSPTDAHAPASATAPPPGTRP